MTAEPNVDFPQPSSGASKAPVPRGWRQLVRAVMATRIDKSGVRLRYVGLAFIGVFCLICGKLALLGFRPDTSDNLRSAASEAVSGARPDILDRNGQILATDIKTMSVFAEPRRIIDKDEAVELLTAVLPDVDAHELRDPPGLAQGVRLGQARHHAEPAGGGLSSRAAGHRLPAREPPRLPQRADRGPRARLHQSRQPGHRRASRNGSTARAWRTCTAPASSSRRRTSKPITLSVDLKAHPCGARRACQGHRALQGEVRRPPRSWTSIPRRGDRLRVAARLRPEQSRGRARPQPHQPPDGGGCTRWGSTFKANLHRHGAGGPTRSR